MVCASVQSIIPSLKLGDYLSVQAHKPCSISHLSFKLWSDIIVLISIYLKNVFTAVKLVLFVNACFHRYLYTSCIFTIS